MLGVLRERANFYNSMDIAIVTGAETPLGLRIIKDLIQQGCRVHGIGNNLSKVTFSDRHFVAHAIDVSDLTAVQQAASDIIEKEGALHILIHALDVTPGADFDKLPVGNLEAVLKIGLLGPAILTRLALPNLMQFRGQLIHVIPTNKSGHPTSAVNALVEGGLRQMNAALFDQARDAGLKVTNLILKQNVELPSATASDEQLEQARIDLEQVARTIDYLLNANETNVPNEITLHPRLSPHAEVALPEEPLPVDPYDAIVLPPAKYCPPEEPKIPTKQPENIERTIPFTDEEMEDKIAAAIEDFEIHPERYETKTKETTPEKSAPQGDGSSKRRRGRRRGGRNRNRNRDNTTEREHTTSEPNTDEPKTDTAGANEEKSEKPNQNRRRRGARQTESEEEKPANKRTKQVTESKSGPKAKKKAEAKANPNSARAKTDKPAPATEKPVKKKATKKAAKKTVKKAATKKAAKKAAKKKKAKKATRKAAKKKAIKKAE